MLNIGKLAPEGGADYYLGKVASGVEDYYTGRGEAPGYWLGSGTDGFGLSGLVDAEDLRSVLAGQDPNSGEYLPRTRRRRLPGFDLTFRAPKSVALLYGIADDLTSRHARDAHDAAVAAAFGYLERSAARTRRGRERELVDVEGLVGAAFRHRTSRAGDPLLHTHVLVTNLARTVDDGEWRALDGRALYVHAKTAGCLYQAHLRDELTRRLGVDWQEVVHGYADVDGVPREVIEAFSTRRMEILERMAERGERSAKSAQTATLATRQGKNYQPGTDLLRARWREQADQLGFGPRDVQRLLHRTRNVNLTALQTERCMAEMAGPAGLTERFSTFSRRDVLQAWCLRLPTGAPVTDVEQLTDGFLAPTSDAVVALTLAQRRTALTSTIRRQDGVLVPSGEEMRYSTPELLAIEHRAVASAVARRSEYVAVASRSSVDSAVGRRPSLSAEQARMVRRLTEGGAGVEVVVGKAGAGKTFALDAAREAWRTSDVPVVGVALAARAAAELQAGSGIPSSTLHSLLAREERPDVPGSVVPPGGVLVVDEAGMVGTRLLAQLLELAERRQAKVVIVGDNRQLPEIDAGGLFRGLANRVPSIELTENRRQHQEWESGALDELRHGDPGAAVTAYLEQDRLVVGDTAEAVRQQLVGDWWSTRERLVDEDLLMVALRVSDVEDLNRRARARLAAAGEIGRRQLVVGDRGFAEGDRVVCCRNDRRLGVVNGTRATVLRVRRTRRTLAVRPDGEKRVVELPTAYLEDGHLMHAYAVTAHKAQGTTVDSTFVLGSDEMYREWGYVALSRGRSSNRLYVVDADGQPDDAHTLPSRRDSDPAVRMERWLRRSRAERLAIDHDLRGAEMPEYIGRLVGAPPVEADDLRAWSAAVRAVEGYRQRWGITDGRSALGGRPEADEQYRHRREVVETLLTVRRRLFPDVVAEELSTEQERFDPRGRGLG